VARHVDEGDGHPVVVDRQRVVGADRQLAGIEAVAVGALDAVTTFAAEPGGDDITLCVLGR
jgi:hypothetical protein